jgi:short-subunit dehydrogenase
MASKRTVIVTGASQGIGATVNLPFQSEAHTKPPRVSH